MNIQVQVKTIYGNQTIYPICDKAKTFAKMLRQTTLTMTDVNNIKNLGFEVEVIQPVIKL